MSQPPIANEKLKAGARRPSTGGAAAAVVDDADGGRPVAARTDAAAEPSSLMATSNRSPSSVSGSRSLARSGAADPARFEEAAPVSDGGQPLSFPSPSSASLAVFAEASAGGPGEWAEVVAVGGEPHFSRFPSGSSGSCLDGRQPPAVGDERRHDICLPVGSASCVGACCLCESEPAKAQQEEDGSAKKATTAVRARDIWELGRDEEAHSQSALFLLEWTSLTVVPVHVHIYLCFVLARLVVASAGLRSMSF